MMTQASNLHPRTALREQKIRKWTCIDEPSTSANWMGDGWSQELFSWNHWNACVPESTQPSIWNQWIPVPLSNRTRTLPDCSPSVGTPIPVNGYPPHYFTPTTTFPSMAQDQPTPTFTPITTQTNGKEERLQTTLESAPTTSWRGHPIQLEGCPNSGTGTRGAVESNGIHSGQGGNTRRPIGNEGTHRSSHTHHRHGGALGEQGRLDTYVGSTGGHSGSYSHMESSGTRPSCPVSHESRHRHTHGHAADHASSSR